MPIQNSLVSVAKWEAKWNKPFINKKEKELQRIAEIFEVDLNLYSPYVKAIDREIGLIKKWRQRDKKMESYFRCKGDV